jgi:signal transduction histidine kinase
MEAVALLYLSIFLVSAFISLFTSVISWQRQQVPGAFQYSLVAFNQAIWTIFMLTELLSTDMETKLFWDNLQWYCAALNPAYIFWFAIQYTGVKLSRPRQIWALLLAPAAIFMVLVATNPWHRLVRLAMWIQTGPVFRELTARLTPTTLTFAAYSLIVFTIAIGLLLFALGRMAPVARRQTYLVMLALAAPYLGGILAAAGFQVGPVQEVLPIWLGLSNLIALAGLFRWRLFDISTLARDQVVENLHDEVMVLDGNNTLVYLNQAALRRLGKPAIAVLGSPVEQVYGEWPDLAWRLQQEVEGEPFTTCTPQGEPCAYQIRITPLLDRFGRVIGRAALLNDVTRLMAIEDELRRHRLELSQLVDQRTAELTVALEELQHSKGQLEQRVAERTAELAAQNRELETFAYSVSHDLKAPLRGIDGYSRLLEENSYRDLDADGRQFLANIRRATEQMHQLINDLLAYARFQRQPLTQKQVRLDQLLDTILEDYKDDLAKRRVDVSLTLGCLAVHTEVEGLSQALRNLIDNAVKFTRDRPSPQIEIGSKSEEQGCLIWVKDNGVGFDMNYHDRIFEIFQRLHRSEDYPGTGVGLALVQKAVQRIGGRVWGESAPGFGATFYILLPAEPPGEEHQLAAQY